MESLTTDPESDMEEDWRDDSLPTSQSSSPQSTENWDTELGEEAKPCPYQNVTFYPPQPMDRGLDIH